MGRSGCGLDTDPETNRIRRRWRKETRAMTAPDGPNGAGRDRGPGPAGGWPRRGRAVTRLVVVWLALSVAVLLVAQVLPAFALDSWTDALQVGAVLGVVNAMLWPVLVRLVLGFTVLTLGVGAFVLYGGLVWVV